MSKNTIFQNFLLKNSISPTKHLPIVHSTEAHVLSKCFEQGTLKRTPCEVFEEDLLYFFVGRPAYKKIAAEEAEYWELPSCVIFDFDLAGAKRIFPFDTGAYRRKKYPSYINMMPMEEYEFDISENNVKRAIGAFFQDNKSYYRLLPFSDEKFSEIHDLDATDAEIKALHKLIRARSSAFDDRRFSLEIQYDQEIQFTDRRPLYCVVPETYTESQKFIKWVSRYNTVIDTYPVYPLRKDYYYSAIYEKIENFYRESGFYEI